MSAMAKSGRPHSLRQKQIQYLNRGRKSSLSVLGTKFSAPGFRFRACQYIEGDPSPDESCKCGEAVVPGTAYCPTHLERTRTRDAGDDLEDDEDEVENDAPAAA
jgi:hypothetical protein